ncbi:ABC transporter permease [Streptomyces bambusae]|uniref:ABC transporter permease n=2 Tax=Streptomyces bambusae TaxID=1550616 RepID=A0ABS6Z835_9ACTN|nr:ABC transporter permease [Streptomyces bambusae]
MRTVTELRTVTEPRARFRDLVAAEWIKLWSLRSTRWVFAVGGLAVVALNTNAAYRDYRAWPAFGEATRDGFDRTGALRDAFTNMAAMNLILVVAAVGAVAVVGEYGTGLIRTTFAAVPARRSLMAAKAAVVAGATAGFGVIVAVVSFLVTQGILAGRGAAASIGDPGALRVLAASALLAPVAALTGMALGTLIRHSATTVVCAVLVLLMLPVGLGPDTHMTAVIDHALPYSAWDRLVSIDHAPRSYPSTVGGAWAVYAVWALAAAAATVTAVHRRDH